MFCFIFASIFCSVCIKSVPAGKTVKIVKEPANYGGMQSYQAQTPRGKITLKALRKENNFSGPYHLRKLAGKCFSLTDKTYKYELCPFANVTQHEQTWRWNAFHGILGIWKEWLIVNNTFQAMIMDDGDECPGKTHRKSKVLLKCGNANTLESVKEPSTCAYEVIFKTPLACPLDAFLVYPSLSVKHQKEWEGLEEALFHDELTLKGYQKRRRALFIKAGLQVQETDLQKDNKHIENIIPVVPKTKQTNQVFTNATEFQTKEQCHQAYSQLLLAYMTLRNQTVSQHSDNNR